MLYNLLESKKYVYTAGKITLATAFFGIVVFAFIFIFNAGKTELMKVSADSATTTLTVLNTPPSWVQFAVEASESSATSPTNSGNQVSWVGVASDPNGADYYLLVCDTNATPTAVNSGAPYCTSGVQWGVSSVTTSGAQATVSTTTTEVAPFASSNNWYAWVCDNDAVYARCNASSSQGVNATNSSPFVVNFRPSFTNYYNNSPADPGANVTFYSTSTDSDGHNITLVVCSTASYSTTTNDCGSNTIATTTGSVTTNATAVYTIPVPMPDNTYNAFGYLVDQYGHEASGGSQGNNSIITVNNVTPTVNNIQINGGADLNITNPASETVGFSLSFTTNDANSCRTTANQLEMVNYTASLYRSGVGSTSCDGTNPAHYNPNSCYTSAVATTTWNLTCTASTTSCAAYTPGIIDTTMNWTCTFPLWYVTDPTDPGSQYPSEDWLAGIAGVDDDNATGSVGISVTGQEVNSASYLRLLNGSEAIPYGQLEPGQNSGTLNASTTIESTGNTGIDQNLSGESMCTTFSVGSPCVVSATSTVPVNQQQFGTSSIAYGSGVALATSTQELEVNVPKSTSTTTPSSRSIYWGIAVPGSISLAGSYTGLNTIAVVTGESSSW